MAPVLTSRRSTTKPLRAEYLVIDSRPEVRAKFGARLIKDRRGITFLSEETLPPDLLIEKYRDVLYVCRHGLVTSISAYLPEPERSAKVRAWREQRKQERKKNEKFNASMRPLIPRPIKKPQAKSIVRHVPSKPKLPEGWKPGMFYSTLREGSLSWHIERLRFEERQLLLTLERALT